MIGIFTLLLRTTGRRSSATRTNSLVYARDGDDYLVVASNGDADCPPSWLHNLKAQPGVKIQIGRERRQATPRIIEPSDPGYEYVRKLVNAHTRDRCTAYHETTTRPIPVIAITPACRVSCVSASRVRMACSRSLENEDPRSGRLARSERREPAGVVRTLRAWPTREDLKLGSAHRRGTRRPSQRLLELLLSVVRERGLEHLTTELAKRFDGLVGRHLFDDKEQRGGSRLNHVADLPLELLVDPDLFDHPEEGPEHAADHEPEHGNKEQQPEQHPQNIPQVTPSATGW